MTANSCAFGQALQVGLDDQRRLGLADKNIGGTVQRLDRARCR